MSEQVKKIRSLADLQEIKKRIGPRMNPEDAIRVVVGLGTCGVAAGARPVYDAIEKSIAEAGIGEHITLEATGCVGICQFEPVVEIYEPNGVRTTYVHMTEERAQRVVQQHLRGGNPLAEFTIGAAKIRR